MKILILFTISFVINSCSIFKINRYPSSLNELDSNTVAIQGLENLSLSDLDEWSKGFYSNDTQLTVNEYENILKRLNNIYDQTKNEQEFYEVLLTKNFNNKYSTNGNLNNLINSLLVFRKKIQVDLKEFKKTSKLLLLLDFIVDETLFIKKIKFPKSRQLFSVSFKHNKNLCKKKSFLNGVEICQGDIVLSKGGAGSSNFLAKISNFPGNYSHSALSYIHNNSKFYFVESFIEDGVKLRKPNNDYINNPKVKLAVYRHKDRRIVKESSKCVLNFIKTMKRKVHTRKIYKLFTKAAFPYDFSMDANDSEAMFCSEVIFAAYNKKYCNLNIEDNPYKKEVWSKLDNSETNGRILKDFLNTKLSFPAPSNLELNSDYEIIANQYNLDKIEGDRVRVAMIDIIMEIIKNNKDKLDIIFDKLKLTGNSEVSPLFLRLMLKKAGIKMTPKIEKSIKNLPKGINYKQFVFFAYLDKKLTPEIEYFYANSKMKGKYIPQTNLRNNLYFVIQESLTKFAEKLSQFK